MKKRILIVLLFFILFSLGAASAQETNLKITRFGIEPVRPEAFPRYSIIISAQAEGPTIGNVMIINDIFVGMSSSGNSFLGEPVSPGNMAFENILTKEIERSVLKEGENELILSNSGQGVKIKFSLSKVPKEWEIKVISINVTNNDMPLPEVKLERSVKLEQDVLGGLPGGVYLQLKGLEGNYTVHANNVLATRPNIEYVNGIGIERPPIVAYQGEAEIGFKLPKINYDKTNTIFLQDWNNKNKGIIINFDIAAKSEETMFWLDSVDYSNEIVSKPSLGTAIEFSALGEFVMVDGYYFPKNEEYTIYYNGKEVKKTRSDKRGYLQDAFELTEELNPVLYTLDYDGGFFNITDTLAKPLNIIALKQNGKTIIAVLHKGSTERRFLFKRGIPNGGSLSPVLYLVPRYGDYGDKIKIYGQGLEAEKSYDLEIGYGLYKTIKVKTDEYGKFHVSDILVDPPTLGKLWMFLKTLFGKKPSAEDTEEALEELRDSYGIDFLIKTDPAVFGSSGFGFSFYLCKQFEKRGLPCL